MSQWCKQIYIKYYLNVSVLPLNFVVIVMAFHHPIRQERTYVHQQSHRNCGKVLGAAHVGGLRLPPSAE